MGCHILLVQAVSILVCNKPTFCGFGDNKDKLVKPNHFGIWNRT